MRVVLEKPIGHDLASSKVINDQVAEFFDESQIYRIDHYLGKETVLNLSLCVLPTRYLRLTGITIASTMCKLVLLSQ